MTRKKKKRQHQSSTETDVISQTGEHAEERSRLDTTPEETTETSLSSTAKPSPISLAPLEAEFTSQITTEQLEQEKQVGMVEKPSPISLAPLEAEFTAQIPVEQLEQEEQVRMVEEPSPSSLELPEQEAAAPPAPVVEGFFAKLARWWQRARPVELEPTIPEISGSEMSFPDVPPPKPVIPSNPPAVKGTDSPSPSALEMPSFSGPTPTTSPLDKVFRKLYLKRVEAELEDVREELEKVKRDTALHIRQLEAERDQSRLDADKERAERHEIELRTRPLQITLDSMERRLEEERLSAQARLQELEALVNSSRAANAEQDLSELQLRVRLLEAQLDVAGRELAAAKGQSEEQIHKLREERRELERQLAAKEQELGTLLSQTTQAQERASRLEAVLQGAQERMAQLGAELAERNAQVEQLRAAHPITAADESTELPTAPAAATSSEESGLLPPDVAADFHQQAMSTLTVILAAADLLAMNQRLDPSLRETAREIRTQGQKVVDLIKGITYPEKAKEGEAASS